MPSAPKPQCPLRKSGVPDTSDRDLTTEAFMAGVAHSLNEFAGLTTLSVKQALEEFKTKNNLK